MLTKTWPWVFLATLLSSVFVSAQSFVPERAFTEVLPENTGQEWFWVSGSRLPSVADGQAFLFGEDGRQLGQLSTGFWFKSLLNAYSRNEIITLETHFARTHRGHREDVLAVYDAETLNLKREIDIPPKRLQSVKNGGLMRLSDDERFLLVVNYTPAQSVSVVDLDAGAFVEEVETPGCSVLYTAGDRDFYSICGNGSFMHVQINDSGRVVSQNRTEPLFDAVNDFLTISASRVGDSWYFVSRKNNVYAIRMAGDSIERTDQWSLLTEDEKDNGWGISGYGHTAAHALSGELYVLMRQGEPEDFEQPGTDVWVYDLETREKVREIALDSSLGSLSIAVSQSVNPRLFTLDFHVPMPWLFTAWVYFSGGEVAVAELARQRASVYDAVSGDHILYSTLVPRGGYVLNIQAW